MKTRAWQLLAGCAALGGVLGARSAAATPPFTGPILYELGPGSQNEQGCFDPCACIWHFFGPMRGSFCLTYVSSDQWTDYYRVSNVEFVVPIGQAEQHLAGAGTYEIGGDFALTNRIVLDLSTDGGPVQHWDSSYKIVHSAFPAINIEATINNRECYDVVLTIAAAPTPADWDHNGRVNSGDVSSFLQAWFHDLVNGTHDADFDRNGTTNSADVTAFLNVWFGALAQGC